MPEASEKLFDEVLSDARGKAERASRQGAKEAAEIRSRIDAETKASVEKILGDAQALAESRRNQILATVAVEVQRERLARLEKFLTEVYEQIRGDLDHLPPDLSWKVQLRLALEAVSQIPSNEILVAMPAADHSRADHLNAFVAELTRMVASELKRNVVIRPASDPAGIKNGVVVRAADGRVEVIDSLAERLRRLWPTLRLEVAEKLFPNEVAKEK